MMGIETNSDYILDHTNHLIHYYRCSKVGQEFERISMSDYTHNYLWPNKVPICKTCDSLSTLRAKNAWRTIGLFLDALMKLTRIPLKEVDFCNIWIESPSGYKVLLPIYQALRIVRKQGWDFAEVVPIKQIKCDCEDGEVIGVWKNKPEKK